MCKMCQTNLPLADDIKAFVQPIVCHLTSSINASKQQYKCLTIISVDPNPKQRDKCLTIISLDANPKQRDKYIQQQLELDLELDISNEKIKRISDSWGARNPHRRSGGGIEDYLDEKTLQHLEELNILDPPPEKSFKTNQEKDIADTNCFQISEISKQVRMIL